MLAAWCRLHPEPSTGPPCSPLHVMTYSIRASPQRTPPDASLSPLGGEEPPRLHSSVEQVRYRAPLMKRTGPCESSTRRYAHVQTRVTSTPMTLAASPTTPSTVYPISALRDAMSPCAMKRLGRPTRPTWHVSLVSCANSRTADPNPPANTFSSTVTTWLYLSSNSSNPLSASGLTRLALTTPALIPISASRPAASVASCTPVPVARSKTSSPSFKTSIQGPLSGLGKSGKSTPNPGPRGNLMATGALSSIALASRV